MTVVASSPKPAVVQHQQLGADIPGIAGQLHHLPVADLEVKRLPAVHQDRTFPILPVAADDVTPDKGVHLAADAVKSPGRVGHDGLRRIQTVTRKQLPAQLAHALCQANTAISVHLCRSQMVSGIEQVQCPHVPVLLIRAMAADHGKGVAAVGADTGDAAPAQFSAQWLAHCVHLSGPGTPEGHQIVLTHRKIQLLAHETVDPNRLCPVVDQTTPPGNHVSILKNRVIEFQIEGVGALLHHDLQRLSPHSGRHSVRSG